MTAPQPTYWPFPVLPPEQRTEQHQRQVQFLDDAFRAGLHPCKFEDGEYRLESEDGRSAWVISRGRLRGGTGTRWEVWLNEGRKRMSSIADMDFEAATLVVFHWLTNPKIAHAVS